MDERKLRLKQLKKASRKENNRYTALWKILCFLLLLLAVVVTVAVLAVKLPEMPAMKSLWLLVGEAPVKPLLMNLELPLMAVAAVLWVLQIVTAALWYAGRKKWKKTESYLDYRTLKNTLKQEKKMK